MSRRWYLSGGIGSGKSEVGRMLAGRGAAVIDADRAGHRVLEPDGEAHAAVAAAWPHVVVDGVVDRAALAGVVFSDRDQLRRLEAITHPAIARVVAAQVADAGDRPVIVEIPLPVDVFGLGWRRAVVYAPVELRRERLIARGMDPDDIDRRMAAQPDDDGWRALADHLVDNSGDRKALAAEVERFWTVLVGPAEFGRR